MLVILETIDRHTWSARLDSAASTALTNLELQSPYQGTVQPIMGNHVQMLPVRVQLKDAGTLGPREMDGLGGDDLENLVQVESRGND